MNEKIGVNQRSKDYEIVRFKGIKMSRNRAVWLSLKGEIPKGMFIHHINGNKRDDKIEILHCVTRKEHGKLHRKPNRIRIKYPSGAIEVLKK